MHELELVEMPRLSANKLHMLLARWMKAGDNIYRQPLREFNVNEDLHTPIATRKNDVSVDLSSTGEDDTEVSEQSVQDVDEDEERVDEDKESAVVVMTPV